MLKTSFLYAGFHVYVSQNRVCAHSVQNDQPHILPGMRYSLDEQCAFKFGEGYTHTVSNKLLFCRICLQYWLFSACFELHILIILEKHYINSLMGRQTVFLFYNLLYMGRQFEDSSQQNIDS